LIADPAAASGQAWAAIPGVHQAGAWYGPYTTALPAGHSYRALFWLRATPSAVGAAAATALARLDVTDDEGRIILGLRDLSAADFVDAAAYRPLAVDFHLFAAPRGLEFRVAWPGLAPLALDRVEVWQLPDAQSANAAHFGWTLLPNRMTQAIAVRAGDAAGNLSAAQPFTFTVLDQSPPYFDQVPTAVTWRTTNGLVLTATVRDTMSGIDLSAGAVTVTGDQYTSAPLVTLVKQETIPESAVMRTVLHDLPDGVLSATFVAYDQAGNRGEASQLLYIDTTAPTVALHPSGQPTGDWYLAPLTLTATATDQSSGVAGVTYAIEHNGTHGTVAPYTAPLVLTAGGRYTTTVWANDQAGQQSAAVHFTAALDLAPPTLWLTPTVLNATTVRVAWRAVDDGSGVADLRFATQAADEEWVALATPPASATGALTVTVLPDQPLRLRGQATDRVGRTSAPTELLLWVPTDWVYLPVVSR
jgi:hypothetical protein